MCWMVHPPSRDLVSVCLPLSPLCWMVSLLGWRVRLPEPSFPTVSAHVCVCARACVRLCLMVRLSCRGLVSPCFPLRCLPSCFPLLDSGSVSAFPSPCLAPVRLCWMAFPPSPGLAPLVCHILHCLLNMRACVFPSSSPLVSLCLSACVPVVDGVPAFPRSCPPMSPTSPPMCACV